jgi:hypothetical protein
VADGREPRSGRRNWARWERRLDDAYDRMERELAAAGVPRHSISGWPPRLRAEIERAWEHIFDLDACPPDEYRQATVEELRASDVVCAVRPISADRGCCWKR